jgi:hypothetical protein
LLPNALCIFQRTVRCASAGVLSTIASSATAAVAPSRRQVLVKLIV